ncbi:MAG: LLM class flavin-dependent oxidoreductase [Rhizobiales bacterium]|nr:LLM class flavin-dependent oxidoreductase [Hyphomicrobiales bacterium]
MDFGIFNIMQQRQPSKTPKEVYAEAIEQTMVAEQLGFGRSWYAEHHFSNYSLCPSPLMMVAHMAARTSRIRLGTAVVVAPLYTPGRLLSEIGMVDILSDGRLDLGIGIGYQGYEFDRFGVDLKYAREISGEMLDLIELGLREQAFEYKGKHLQQPRSSIACKPLQKPIPPIWYAGGDPDHLRRLARSDYTLFVSGVLGGITRIKALRGQFEQAAVAEGKDPARVKFAVSRLAFVSKNKADVMRFVESALYQQRLAVSLKMRREQVQNDYIVQETAYEDEPSIEAILRNLPVGDVETCIEKMVRLVRELKPVHIMIQTQVGDVEHKKSLAAMELWAGKVIPGILKELGKTTSAAA